MEIYHDFYGCHARIQVSKSGAARLTVRGKDGKLFHAKNYKTRTGAIRAMGRLSDGWTRIPATKP